MLPNFFVSILLISKHLTMQITHLPEQMNHRPFISSKQQLLLLEKVHLTPKHKIVVSLNNRKLLLLFILVAQPFSKIEGYRLCQICQKRIDQIMF